MMLTFYEMVGHLVSGYPISLHDCSSVCQRETTQVKLVLQSKLSFVCVTKLVLSAQVVFKTGLRF